MNSSQSECGQNIVEYALVLPMVMVLLLGIVEFSLVVFSYNTIANAAREGARAGVIPPNTACDLACSDAKVLAAANTLTTGLDPGALQIAIVRPGGDTVQVTVNYAANLITGPMIAAVGGDSTIPLQTVATMRLEGR